MKHIRLQECDSTQIYLKDCLNSSESSESLCISTLNQTAGRGRNDNSWSTFGNSLAFSFSYAVPRSITLAPLFFGLCTARWLDKKYCSNILLKWPNDLFVGNSKVGGILCHLQDQTLIVGVGINLGPRAKLQDENFKFRPGKIIQREVSDDERHEISFEIAKFIESSSFDDRKIVQGWNSKCVHLDKNIKFNNDTEIIEGNFKGISSIGEAIVETSSGKEQKFISGSIDWIRT